MSRSPRPEEHSARRLTNARKWWLPSRVSSFELTGGSGKRCKRGNTCDQRRTGVIFRLDDREVGKCHGQDAILLIRLRSNSD